MKPGATRLRHPGSGYCSVSKASELGMEPRRVFLSSLQWEGSPNLQCERQHLRTTLNALAPHLAIFKRTCEPGLL